MRWMTAVLIGLLALVPPFGAGAQTPATLQVIVFPGGFNWPIKLRSEYGRPQKELTDPTRYIDLSYYERARP